MSNTEQLPALSLSDIIEPDSLTIENYGNERPTKVFLAGMHSGLPLAWHALYCELRPDVRERIEPNLVDGDVSAIQLVRQLGGPHKGRLVAIASPTCGIGSHRMAVVDSLGDCTPPTPFLTLGDLAR